MTEKGDSIEVHATMERIMAELLGSCERSFRSGQYSDITVYAFGQPFPLHKLVLSGNSYFRSLMEGPWQEQGKSTLEVRFDDPNITIEAFKIVIARMYGVFDPMCVKSRTLSLLATACFLDDVALCSECVEFIGSDLSPATVPTYVSFATSQSYGIHTDAILSGCLIHLCKNAASPEYRSCVVALPDKLLRTLLVSDGLFVTNEVERYKLIQSILDERKLLLLGHEMESGRWFDAKHVRGASVATLVDDTVVEEEATLTANELTFSTSKVSSIDRKRPSEQSPVEDIEALSKSILARSILFSNIPYKVLAEIKQTDKRLPADSLHKALWQQTELRALVLSADREAVELGISYESQTDSVDDWEASSEAISESASATEPKKGVLMPTEDTETMEGSRSVIDLVSIPTLWNKMDFPPCRFGYEFTEAQLLRLVETTAGIKIYSSSHFYAGSMWQLYIQKVDGDDGSALGVYMQRVGVERDPRLVEEGVSYYVDNRLQARVWFQILCYFAESSCVLESKPDLFKVTQSWGWRSTKMYRDMFGASGETPKPFKCAVVIGQT